MTSKYSLDSLASSSLTFNSTSSTTRTRAVIGLCRYLREKPLDRAHEAGDRDRLCNIGFATAVADLLLVALHRKGGHRDDRHRPQHVIFLAPFGDVQAGERGHLAVHEQQVSPVGAGQQQRL